MTGCRKKGTAPYTKIEVTTRRDAVYSIKVTSYDNGWLPVVALCRPAKNDADDEICKDFGGMVSEEQLLNVQRLLEKADR
jgi:hypothetical protein